MQSPDISEVTKELEKVVIANSLDIPTTGKRKRFKNVITKLQNDEKQIYKSLTLDTIPDKKRKIFPEEEN